MYSFYHMFLDTIYVDIREYFLIDYFFLFSLSPKSNQMKLFPPCKLLFFEVKLSCDPVFSYVGWLLGRSVGLSVIIS